MAKLSESLKRILQRNYMVDESDVQCSDLNDDSKTFICCISCPLFFQERLLLSVLPEHVAVKMRQDLGSTDSEQFKKIYMSRHENVR